MNEVDLISAVRSSGYVTWGQAHEIVELILPLLAAPSAPAEQAAWEKEKERMQLQIDALYAEALRYKTLVEQAAPEAWVDEIMSLAHRWAQASYMKGLRKPYEDFEPIKRKMRELLRAAPAQEGKK